jgi:hypothetical protein
MSKIVVVVHSRDSDTGTESDSPIESKSATVPDVHDLVRAIESKEINFIRFLLPCVDPTNPNPNHNLLGRHVYHYEVMLHRMCHTFPVAAAVQLGDISIFDLVVKRGWPVEASAFVIAAMNLNRPLIKHLYENEFAGFDKTDKLNLFIDGSKTMNSSVRTIICQSTYDWLLSESFPN